ncbi:MAG: complex I NDUFA9 subunit family protein [Gammaproteobacteria bacterium]|nr:complex I NDUFA9 subunit family protein [Gammaproteobacteria bacterium]
MPVRVCIFGGTGFIGHHLLALLNQQGCMLRVPSRQPQRHRDLAVLPNVELVRADVFDPQHLKWLVRDCDAIINLIGILNESGHDGRGFRRVHVELVEQLITACQATDVQRFIQVSALKADAKNGPSHYLRSKGQAEQLLRQANSSDFKVTIMRPSVVFGPNDSFINRFANLLRFSPGWFPLPRANARMAPVYVGDVCTAIQLALNDVGTAGKTYQLCGQRVMSLREILAFIIKQQERRVKIVQLPDALAKLQAAVMDWLPGKPFSTDNFRSLTVHSLCDKNGFEKLGITPTSFDCIVPQMLATVSVTSTAPSFETNL